MCQNNLREAFDAYAVDPNNPNSPTDRTSNGLLLPAVQDDGLLLPAVQGLLLPAVQDTGLLLPAVQDTGLLLPAVQPVIDVGDSAWDQSYEFRPGKWTQTDYSFDLV